MENIDNCKKERISGQLKYRLKNANVFVSPCGYHYIDYLDPTDEISPEIDESRLTLEEMAYIENTLHANKERFENQVETVKSLLGFEKKQKPDSVLQSTKVLDIGCGGGLFLSMLATEGADVTGIELNDQRAYYSKRKYKLDVIKRPIENDYWLKYHATFDVVTLWDVIEHVNYPLATLQAATSMLKKNGLLFLDTPCRDNFYHRVGELTYKLTNGRFSILNSMYSSHKFGHKQIFSTNEMRDILCRQVGLEVVKLYKFHELSFPCVFYLKRIIKSNFLANLFSTWVRTMLILFPVKNKMLVVGRKI